MARGRLGDAVLTTVGFVLHLVLLPFVLASGLVVPAGVVVALTVVWVALLVVAVRNRRRERVVLAAPIITVALLVVVPTIGELVFDWQA